MNEFLSFEEFQENVLGWAKYRDLLHEENAGNQYLKFLEKVGETARFLLLRNASEDKLISKGFTRSEVEKNILDGFGDIAVTIVILAEQTDSDSFTDQSIWESCPYDFRAIFQEVYNDCVEYTAMETLYSIADSYDLNFNECITLAWNEIKDRTGKTVNGTFIKD